MKTKLFKLSIAGILGISLLFTSCKKEEKLDVSSIKKPSNTATKTVSVPTSLSSSSNTNAQACASYITMFNAIGSYSSVFNIPETAEVCNDDLSTFKSGEESEVYTWSDGVNTVYYVVTDETDKYTWTIYYSGNGYTKAKFLYAEEMKDASKGYLEIFDYTSSSTTSLGKWSWEPTSKGILYTYELLYLGYNMKITLNANTDNTGDLSYYYSGALYAYYTWNADGTGTYATYSDGVVEYSGSW
ncbi:MAG: hypothetical protein IPO21_00755 [Bacteroidales bacterium]|nr:hypothetical protein [Bacteroidales bacterium]